MLKVRLPRCFTTSIKTPEARCGSPRRESLIQMKPFSLVRMILQLQFTWTLIMGLFHPPAALQAGRVEHRVFERVMADRRNFLLSVRVGVDLNMNHPVCVSLVRTKKHTKHCEQVSHRWVGGAQLSPAYLSKTYLLHKTHFCWGWVLSFFLPNKNVSVHFDEWM